MIQTITALIIIFIFGAVFGSFACCQAWRLYLRNQKQAKKKQSSKNQSDKTDSIQSDTESTKKQQASKNTDTQLGRRSVCLHCHRQLRWYDNIPIISWIALKGKCRYCHKPIGAAEILAEIGMGLGFVAVLWRPVAVFFGVLPRSMCTAPFCALPDGGSSAYGIAGSTTGSTYDTARNLASGVIGNVSNLNFILTIILLVVLLVMLVILGILAVYDGKWGELPVALLVAAIICGAVVGALGVWIKVNNGVHIAAALGSMAGAVAILAGLYFLFYKVSRERWMGGGDWLLGLGIALALGDWWLALWVLFLSNLIGCLVMLPAAKKDRKHRIHFGPFMVLAFVLVIALASFISNMMILI